MTKTHGKALEKSPNLFSVDVAPADMERFDQSTLATPRARLTSLRAGSARHYRPSSKRGPRVFGLGFEGPLVCGRSECSFCVLSLVLISWVVSYVKSTLIAHTFFSCALCQRACPSLLSQLFFALQSSRHALTSRTRVAQAQHEVLRSVSCPKNRHISSRNVIRYTSLEHDTCTWHVHSFPDTNYLTFLGSSSR